MPRNQVSTESGVPGLEENPDADVLIYDGRCRFCQRQAQRLAGWDRGRRLAFLSLHDPRVPERYPELPPEALTSQMYVVDRRGRRHGGAAAVRYLTRRLPRLWPLAPLLHLPFSLPIWQWLYRRIARIRHRLGTPACDETCNPPRKARKD